MNEVALFQNALRAAVPSKPDPRLGADLVPRLAQIARESNLGAGAGTLTATTTATARRRQTRPRSRFSMVARGGIAVAAVPLVFAGLAFAGVTLPDPARNAFDSVGVTLPNQSENSASDEATQQSPPANPAADQASEQGKQASAAKGANGKHKGQSADKPGRRVRRHGQGPIPGPASAPEGRALGVGKDGGSSNAGGSSTRGKSGSAHTHRQGPSSARGRGAGLSK
jgi:hypothetical protein